MKKPHKELSPKQLAEKEERERQRIIDDHKRNMLSRILSGASLAEKIESIREYNPHFYLLTPKKKGE